jgi:hypothetical protein
MELSQHLLGRIHRWNPKYKVKNIQRWCNDFRLLMSRDQQSFDEVQDVIGWAQADGFWHKNILSADAVRRNFQKLQAWMISEQKVVQFEDRHKEAERERIRNQGLLNEYLSQGGDPRDANQFHEWKRRRLKK